MEWNGSRTGMLAGLFLASGCAALIYEVVWFQQLGLVLGATSVTIGILLASFMGGMGLGSWLYPSLASSSRHPLKDYALLEAGIAVYGGLTLLLLPRLGDFYAAFGTPGTSDLPFRGLVAWLVLCPPTMLMGATLPAVSRGVASTPQGASRLGLFYGANTFGAVLGSLGAGLYVLRVSDVMTATGIAMGLNLLSAAAAWRLSGRMPAADATVKPAASSPWTSRAAIILLVAAGSGATALGAEVVWTRLLALLLGPTTYTFSILLAVFLTGLGIGSAAGAWWTRRTSSPERALALAQLLLLATIPYAAWMIVAVLPGWFSARDPQLTIWDRMGGDVLRATLALLPATCCWGASFPLALASLLNGSAAGDASRWVGRLSAANTLGAIVGALLISLKVHPVWGSQIAQQVLTMIAGGSAVLMIGLSLKSSTSMWNQGGLLAAGLLAAAAAVGTVPVTPAALIAHGNQVAFWNTDRSAMFVREGLDSAVAVMVSHQGTRCFHVSGRIEATNSTTDMRTQRLLGHLPAAAHAEPRSVLVIGCGSGMTAGSFLLHPTVERIVVCEIEPAVVEANRELFIEQNYGVLNHPKTEIVYDDARHFLATTKETFDIITTDPIHPWVRGSAALYTQEFFELCRRRLNPQGIVTQWVPLYESNRAAVQCELATLLKVFPESLIFSGESQRSGYDLVIVGTNGEDPPSLHDLTGRLSSGSQDLRWSLQEIGLGDPRRLRDTFVASGSEIAGWLDGAAINHDWNLRLQYLAGLTPDALSEQGILEEIAAARVTRSPLRRLFTH